MSRPARNRAARRRAARKGDSLPLFPLLVGGIVVLGVIAVLAVTMSGGDDGKEIGPQTRPVAVQGTPLTPLPEEPAPDDQVGATAPTVSGRDFAGGDVEIRADGRPKAVVFLAHWCPHCNNEAPRLAQYVRDTGLPEGVDLYLVPTNTSKNEPRYPPEKWLEDTGLAALDLPTLVDSEASEAYGAYGPSGFPYFVLLDGDNRVVLRLTGELPEGSFGMLFEALARGETPVDPGLPG